MSNFLTFQTQLVSIMEILAKAAVAEINRRVDDSCAVFRLEMSQSQREIEALKQKLQMLERVLMKARGRKAERAFGQDWSFRLWRDGEPTAVKGRTTPLQSSVTRKQSADMEEVRPESLLIKQETLEEDSPPTPVGEELVTQPTPTEGSEEQVAQSTPVEDGKKQNTEPTPAGDLEELSEQHRCGHSDEEHSGLEFVVKAEQEEYVAQIPNQKESEHSAGRLNHLGSEYVMYERNSQPWTSFTQGNNDMKTDDPVCSNTTEQYSESVSVHTERQPTYATVEGSGSTLSSFGSSYVEVFDKMSGKQPVCGEELRSKAIHTQQVQYRERPVHTVERENQTLLPQKQHYGPTVKQMRGGESTTQSHSGSQYEASSTLSASAFNTNQVKAYRRAFTGERRFCCTYCGKGFTHSSHLKEHHRSHTGEKPYCCADCGKRFSKQSNLIRHTIVHSGKKPFRCMQCGKCFTQRSSLKSHQRIHTGQMPFDCIQCLYTEEEGFHSTV